MPVAFDPLIVEPLDRRAYGKEVADALNHPTTRIFLDTNILMWTYGLHLGARTDLCDWLTEGPQKGRIHIPRRVLHEFGAHRKDQQALYPFGQQFKGLTKALESFEQKAPLVADDSWAAQKGFTDRATYLARVSAARDEITRLIEPVMKSENFDTLHAQLIPVFNALALNGNIHDGLALLRDSYEARAELRISPGFKDISKGKRNEEANIAAGLPGQTGANRFGDLAIWDEIINFVSAIPDRPEAVILVTHDGKTDWSYYPGKIIDLDGHTKTNDAKKSDYFGVAQPILVHELNTRAQVPALYILTIRQLAVIANLHAVGFKFVELARAVQAEGNNEQAEEQDNSTPSANGEGNQDQVLTEPDHDLVGKNAQNASAPKQPDALLAFFKDLPRQAQVDGEYTGDPNGLGLFDDAIRGLKSHDWYRQNPAVRQGLTLLSEGRVSLLQAFIFGRNLYQAAVGTSSDAMRALEGLETRLSAIPLPLANACYAGACFELYFDLRGNLRKVPKVDQIDPLFRHQHSELLAPAVGFIQAILAEVHASLLVVPSTDAIICTLNVDVDNEGQVAAVRSGNTTLTQTFKDTDNDASPLPPMISYARLRSMISKRFAIPVAQIQLVPDFDGARKVNRLQFIAWNPVDGPML